MATNKRTGSMVTRRPPMPVARRQNSVSGSAVPVSRDGGEAPRNSTLSPAGSSRAGITAVPGLLGPTLRARRVLPACVLLAHSSGLAPRIGRAAVMATRVGVEGGAETLPTPTVRQVGEPIACAGGPCRAPY